MLQSKLFTKTRKNAPKDELSKNAELLVRAGFIHKEMAGVYSFLPLGLKTLKKVENVVREEMERLGGQEVFLSSLQEKENWEKTGRWDDEVVDNWFKTKLKNETELGLAFTHEEPLSALLRDHLNSYKDLPAYIFQFQTKFRNEIRAKSGIMRVREFLMKDLYSFSKDEKEHNDFYEKAKSAYLNIFDKVGLGDKVFLTLASGGSFSKFSHEFQALTDAGEDVIYLDESKKLAVNKEVLEDDVLKEAGLNRESLIEKKAVEVGNIFSLGTKFSDPLGLNYLNEKGEKIPAFMGSYGIGIGRLMGAVAEILSDENGLVWPSSISPFEVHLVRVGENPDVKEQADEVYKELLESGIDVLYDDRDLRAGEKFADSDLMGISFRLVVSEKNMQEGMIEIKKRQSGKTEMVSFAEVVGRIKELLK